MHQNGILNHSESSCPTGAQEQEELELEELALHKSIELVVLVYQLKVQADLFLPHPTTTIPCAEAGTLRPSGQICQIYSPRLRQPPPVLPLPCLEGVRTPLDSRGETILLLQQRFNRERRVFFPLGSEQEVGYSILQGGSKR